MPDGEVNFTINEANGGVPAQTYSRDQFLATLGYLQYGEGNIRNLDELDVSDGAGFVSYDTSGNVAARTIEPGRGINVTDGDGVSGNPTVSVPAPVVDRTTDSGNITEPFTTVDAASGDKALTLPDASKVSGETYVVEKSDSSSNTVTVNTFGSQTISGSSTYQITSQFDGLTVFSDGSDWIILSNTAKPSSEPRVQTISSDNTDILDAAEIIKCSKPTNNLKITLPAASDGARRITFVQATNSNTDISPASGDEINFSSSEQTGVVTNDSSNGPYFPVATLVSTGREWFIETRPSFSRP